MLIASITIRENFTQNSIGPQVVPGTLQSSNTSSQVLDPLMPSLSNFWLVEKPSMPLKDKSRSIRI